jgi:hypothetical protein
MPIKTYLLTILLALPAAIFVSNCSKPVPKKSRGSAIEFQYKILDLEGPTDPWGKSAGDLNGDGKPDLIAGGHGGGGLVCYQAPDWKKVTIDTGKGFSTDHEVVDIDNDGDMDVITVKANDIRWYENPEWKVHIIQELVLHDVEVADLDKDGKIDAVARDQSAFGDPETGEWIHLYKQEGPDSWKHRKIRCERGEGLLVYDLDMDGDQDIIVNESWFENSGNILEGEWKRHVYAPAYKDRSGFIAAGDINGDGRPDLACSPSELARGYYHISWFEAPRNVKSGTWKEHIVERNVETIHHYCGVADMDSDGDIDIVSAEMHQGQDPDEVKLFLNQGRGTAWKKLVIGTEGSHSMRIVDTDGDGDLDLFGSNWGGQRIEMWKNMTVEGGGAQKWKLDSWQTHIIDSLKPWTRVLIDGDDIDGDDNVDIITGGWWYKNPGAPAGQWKRNDIGGELYQMAAVHDFDGDGDPDILGTKFKNYPEHSPDFLWAENDGSGKFKIHDNIQSADKGDFLQGITIARFEGTATQAALSWHNNTGEGVHMLTKGKNSKKDRWTWKRICDTSQQEELNHGDIDRDGDLDILLGTKWLRNDGWTEWSMQTLHDTTKQVDRNRLMDMNGDSRLDAVIGYEGIDEISRLAWYEQPDSAEASWTQHLVADTIYGAQSLDVADLDKDGDLDIVMGEHRFSEQARVIIFENLDGKSTAWKAHVIATGHEHHDGTKLVDIDSDGDLDIISIGWKQPCVLLYENKAVSSF